MVGERHDAGVDVDVDGDGDVDVYGDVEKADWVGLVGIRHIRGEDGRREEMVSVASGERERWAARQGWKRDSRVDG